MVGIPVRTFENALLDSKSIMGDATGLLQKGLMKKVAVGGDALVDAAVINAGMPDDAAKRAAARKARKHISEDVSPAGLNALLHTVTDERSRRDSSNPHGRLSLVGTQEQPDSFELGQPGSQAQPKEPEKTAMDMGMDVLQTGVQFAGYGLIATEVAPMLIGGAAHMVGLTGIERTLNAPREWLGKQHITNSVTARQLLNDGLQIGIAAQQSFGVAKDFSGNMAALKQMYTDVTGKEAPSTVDMLTASMPPVLSEARSHFLKEYGIRTAIQLAGWGLMARDLWKGQFKEAKDIEAGRLGILAGIVPTFADMGAKMLMGTAATQVYTGFKKAFESGQPLGANDYAVFLLSSSVNLSSRKAGRQVAMAIGTEYAKEKIPPGEILRQINDGRFNSLIEQLLAHDEAAAKQTQPAAPNKEITMVDKTSGAKQPTRPAIGKFTSMLADQSNGVGVVPNMTRP